MDERLTKVFGNKNYLYISASPIMTVGYALYKDNQTGKMLAQLKFQNISQKKIKAAYIDLITFDTLGKELGTVSHQYLDLGAGTNDFFGEKAPIAVDGKARSFNIEIKQVIFADNNTWEAKPNAAATEITPTVPLDSLLERQVLCQYKAKYGENSVCFPRKEAGLWQCACGAWNSGNEEQCKSCGKSYFEVSDAEIKALKALAEAKSAEQSKKLTKIIISIGIAVASIFIIVGAINIISSSMENKKKYNSALEHMEEKRYKAAIEAFTELDGYKDSDELLEKAVIQTVNQYIDKESFDKAEEQLDYLSLERKDEIALELKRYKAAVTASADNMLKPAKEVVDKNKYIVFSEDMTSKITQAFSFAGEWKYSSGDLNMEDTAEQDYWGKILIDAVISYKKKTFNIHVACDNLIYFARFVLSEDGSSIVTADTYKEGYGDVTLKLKDTDTLEVSHLNPDGTVLAWEYKKVLK